MKAPYRLDFTPEAIDELIDRLNNKCLQEEDYPLLKDILKSNDLVKLFPARKRTFN